MNDVDLITTLTFPGPGPILDHRVFAPMTLTHLMRQNNRNNNGPRANRVVVGEGLS